MWSRSSATDGAPRVTTGVDQRASRLLVAACAALVIAIAPGSTARADDTHYQSVLIGDRAFGMGGAATGLAADTSSTFYNPGALAELPNRSFSASLGLTAFERTRVRAGVRGPGSVADLTQSGSRSLPVFSAALLRFGPHGADGLKRHAIAFSTLYPATADVSLRVDLMNPETGIPSTARVDHNYRLTLYGLSYALHLSHTIAFGITAFLATQRMSHRETLFVAGGGVPTPDGGFSEVSHFSAITRIAGRSFGVLPRIGFFYRPNQHVSFGLTFQPPAIPLKGRASLSQQTAIAIADSGTGVTTTYFEPVEQRGMDVRMPIPWMIRLGVGGHVNDSLTLAFDASLHGRVRSRALLPEVDPGAMQRALFMSFDTARRTTFDMALGAEWVMRDGVTWRVGAFTNRSAAPRVPDNTSTYRLERVHHYGASFGLGVHVGAYHLTLGLAGSRGRGSALSVDTDPASTTIYARTGVEERVLYLFVTGATRSVARLARSALHRVRHRGQEVDEDADASDEDREEHPDAVDAEQARRRRRTSRARRPADVRPEDEHVPPP